MKTPLLSQLYLGHTLYFSPLGYICLVVLLAMLLLPSCKKATKPTGNSIPLGISICRMTVVSKNSPTLVADKAAKVGDQVSVKGEGSVVFSVFDDHVDLPLIAEENIEEGAAVTLVQYTMINNALATKSLGSTVKAGVVNENDIAQRNAREALGVVSKSNPNLTALDTTK